MLFQPAKPGPEEKMVKARPTLALILAMAALAFSMWALASGVGFMLHTEVPPVAVFWDGVLMFGVGFAVGFLLLGTPTRAGQRRRIDAGPRWTLIVLCTCIGVAIQVFFQTRLTIIGTTMVGSVAWVVGIAVYTTFVFVPAAIRRQGLSGKVPDHPDSR